MRANAPSPTAACCYCIGVKISSRYVVAAALAGALSGIACATDPPEPVAPSVQPPRAAATPSGPCVASLAESGNAGQPFPADLVKDGTPCIQFQQAQERHCPGVYVAIAEGGGYGGSVRYFDGDKKLIGIWVTSDTNQYCNGASFDIVYGTRPTCPTAEIVKDLCRR